MRASNVSRLFGGWGEKCPGRSGSVQTGFGTKNALPGKWDDCTLKPRQTPIGLGITNESPLVYQSQ